jgi:hypothetical protein
MNRQEHFADVAAGGSAFLAGTAWIAEVEPFITALERARQIRNRRLNDDD